MDFPHREVGHRGGKAFHLSHKDFPSKLELGQGLTRKLSGSFTLKGWGENPRALKVLILGKGGKYFPLFIPGGVSNPTG